MKLEDLLLDVEQHIDVKATPEKAFAAVIHRLGKGNTRPNGESLQLQLEPKAGGRWYRDRGEGAEHLWGFVQVIKPPTLLELSNRRDSVLPSTPLTFEFARRSAPRRRKQLFQGRLSRSISTTPPS